MGFILAVRLILKVEYYFLVYGIPLAGKRLSLYREIFKYRDELVG